LRSLSFFFLYVVHLVDLYSFPTRRSSDLREVDNAIRPNILGAIVENECAGHLQVVVVLRAVLPVVLRVDEKQDEIGMRRLLLLIDRKSTRLNSSHDQISYAVFCLKKKRKK